MKSKFLIFLLFLSASCFATTGSVRDSSAAQGCPTSAKQLQQSIRLREWLFGMGRANVLETYLSPYEYKGTSLTINYRSERRARWGKGKVSTVRNFSANGSTLQKEWGEGNALDGDANFRLAFLYNWQPVRGLRLAIGPMAELGIGGTYHLRSSNNPAQLRIYGNIGGSALGEYAFKIKKRRLTARLLADLPLIGAKFAPHYGQSYYEIFSLAHNDHTVCFTHPFNAPSARLNATLSIKLWGATITAGYLGEVRQSKVNGLKFHSWNNAFVVGFARSLQIIR